jgi:dUTP pyrophosphatase
MLNYYKLHEDVIAPEFATHGSACFDIYAHLGEKIVSTRPNPKVVVYTMDNQKEEREVKMWAGEKGTFYTAVNLHPAERVLVPTGLIFDIPKGYSVRLHPRSGMSLKQGLIMPNGEGIVDCDYYHQTYVMLYNAGADLVQVKHGERIAQGELVKTLDYSLKETTIQPEKTTERVGGFGSTGVE